MTSTTRRISIDLRRWPLRLAFGVRPTVVIDGRTEPAQWGEGTWLVAADRPVTVAVFMFVAGAQFGRADCVVQPEDNPVVVYRAPLIAFLAGSLT